MYNIVILKDNFYSNQTKFFRLYDNIYKNPLVKKVKISYNFFEKNINLF